MAKTKVNKGIDNLGGEVVIYNPDDTVRLDVRLENETVWLTHAQMGLLFGVDRTVIVRHVGNLYKTGELDEDAKCAKIAHLQRERRVAKTEEKIDFFVKTALPPVTGIFYDGQIFQAYDFASRLIKSARSKIVLVDNYVDETVLTMLDKREPISSSWTLPSMMRSTLPFRLKCSQKHMTAFSL